MSEYFIAFGEPIVLGLIAVAVAFYVTRVRSSDKNAKTSPSSSSEKFEPLTVAGVFLDDTGHIQVAEIVRHARETDPRLQGEWIMAAIARMSPDLRAALVMRVVEGRSLDEIAKARDTTFAEAKRLLEEAMREVGTAADAWIQTSRSQSVRAKESTSR
jgi:DNA-directed RNA polymerase specialized sigma24 family protein